MNAENCQEVNSISSEKDNKNDSCSFHLEILYADVKNKSDLNLRCESTLKLALCHVRDIPDLDFSDSINAFKSLSDSFNYPGLVVCHSLLLCSVTKMSMSLDQLTALENCILDLIESILPEDVDDEALDDASEMYRVKILTDRTLEVADDLCKELFEWNYKDDFEIDISTVCCLAFYNLSSLVIQHMNELGSTYCFKNSTLKYILGIMGHCTQAIVSEHLSGSLSKHADISTSSYNVKHCLQVLETALTLNPDLALYSESFYHEHFSLPHCLTRLLGWSVHFLFPMKLSLCESSSICSHFEFHLSTLVCNLKILSVLTFNPHQYDSFTNVKGLMEKIFVCALKAYFESEKSHFDILILCLEMLINLFIKNEKTFILLCLKKFKISETQEVLAIEALIKMLSDHLIKIKEVTSKASEFQKNLQNVNTGNESSTVSNSSVAESEHVLQAAGEDMENSTIVSFISVLVVFFMRTKQSFHEFVQEKITSEMLKEATTVTQKFLEFASFTGGMPLTGILILTQTLSRLQALQSI